MRNAPAPACNLLLDRLPDSYAGYLIRTDYRIGIQIALCLEDPALTPDERAWAALDLLYGAGVPPVALALEGLGWFLRGGQRARDDLPPARGDGRIFFDFDHARIAASFQKTYGLALHRARLHWFEFLALLDSLDEDSSLVHAVQMRLADPAGLPPQRRAALRQAKQLVTPPREFTDEEKAAIAAFFGEELPDGG